ncbi:fungal-specific transcription factor domain-containing protein [Gautieria morchelliformis]|nr:fungal-specific transcription factor domain-containing protein [Gautieria morchelliformis]
MLASFQRHAISLLEIVTLNLQAIIVMHAASVALLLHGVLLASLAGLIMRSNFSAQTVLLIGLLLNIHPKLLSYIQIPPISIQEPSPSADDTPVVHISGESLDSMRTEAISKSDSRGYNDGRQPHFKTGSVEGPRSGFSSATEEATLKAMEAKNPAKIYPTTCHDRKYPRDRRTFDNDEENEPSMTMKSSTTPISCHNGGCPLTPANLPSLDAIDGLGPRRIVSLFNGTRRPRPLFYVSDGSRECLPPPSPPAEIYVQQRIKGEMQLTSKLQDEMKLTARLRNDLGELRDQACTELSQSKHQAQALAVAVGARECFIKDLAASVKLLRAENKVLKNTNRRDGEVLTEALTGSNIDKDKQYLSPKLRAREAGHEAGGVANIISQQSQGFASVQGGKLGQRCVKRASIAFGCNPRLGMHEYIERNDFPADTASWLLLGSVLESPLEPRSSGASIHASPPSLTSNSAKNNKYTINTKLTSEDMDVELPTISPGSPPCHAAAPARRKVASPPSDTVVYEVDGMALAATRAPARLPYDSADPDTLPRSAQLAPIRHSPRLSVNDKPNATCLTSNQILYRQCEASCLAMQQDSPLYTVPASAFILPRAAIATESFLASHVGREDVRVRYLLELRPVFASSIDLSPAICPEGALMTKGTRFVLANTEELHVKIMQMSERIRQLENALSASNAGPGPHPLLREDLLLVKVPVEFTNESNSPQQDPPQKTAAKEKDSMPTLLDAFGTLKIGTDGHSRFYGQTARTEHFVKDEGDPPQPDQSGVQDLLPTDVLHLSQAFPFGSSSPDTPVLRLILDFLPPITDAWPLVDVYYANSSWIYEPCPRPQFEEEVFTHVYEHANDPEGISPHRLALVFAILSHGALMDLSREPYSAYAEQLHQLARASLAASPFLQEPTLPVIQAMFLIGFFLVLINKKEAASTGWAVQGLNCKLAEVLGLHRDLEYWDAEDRKCHGEARRKMFWELVTLEGWMSLGLGRPATIHLSQIDCKLPAATQRAMSAPDASLQEWHTWKHGHARFVSNVLQKTLDAQTPPYSDIIELDRNIHAFEMPPDVEALANGLPYQSTQTESTGLTMQRWLLLQARDTAVLLLHRGFFAQALGEEADPMQSKYAPSVLATYRSACHIIWALYNVYSQEPNLACRFGLFWSNGFSASISLCLIVTTATRSSYAPFALGQLDLAHELFSRAADECIPARKAQPTLSRLRDKAHAAYAPYHNGQHPASLASKKHLPMDRDDDELKILGGKTNVVTAPSQPSLPSPPGRMQKTAELAYPGSPAMVMQLPPTNHLDSVHPSLVQYLAQSPPPRVNSISLTEQPMRSDVYMQQSDHASGGTHEHHRYGDYRYATNSNTSASSTLAGAMPGYNRASGSSFGHVPDQPELQQPHSQSQYAAWQNYMEQLGLPY